MKRLLLLGLCLLLGPTGYASGKGKRLKAPEKTILKMVDPDATHETKALYANLWCIGLDGVMFGHHDYPSYGIGWKGDKDRSDVKDIVGSHPAVYSLDMAGIDDTKIRHIQEAYKRGGVCMLVWHQSNPLTEGPGKKYPVGTAWDNTKVVDRILQEGSPMNLKYKARLDDVAEAFRKMVDEKGRPIPVIFRPLHEHTQTWNWWGRSATTDREFIAFWRFIVSYLRDTKDVHNVIYAISPQMDAVYGNTSMTIPSDASCSAGRATNGSISSAWIAITAATPRPSSRTCRQWSKCADSGTNPSASPKRGSKTTTKPTIGHRMCCACCAANHARWSWHGATTIPGTPTAPIRRMRRPKTSNCSMPTSGPFWSAICPTCIPCPRTSP